MLLLLMTAVRFQAAAQPGMANFHKIGFSEGLHDGIIRCIAQDRFGYIWIGTVGAVNRFDGRRITKFTNIPGDSSSPYGTQPRCMYSDKKGRFWIGTETGLMEYDFTSGKFIRIPGLRGQFILYMTGTGDSILYLGSRREVFRYNTNTGEVFSYRESKKPAHAALSGENPISFCVSQNRLMVGTRTGLIVLDSKSDSSWRLEFRGNERASVISVDADRQGNIWLYSSGKAGLTRITADLKNSGSIDISAIGPLSGGIVGIMADQQEGVWLITDGEGLHRYFPATQQFQSYRYNIYYPSGPSADSYRYIFQDRDGLIWLGCNVEGINYFEPGQHLFQSILPFEDKRSKHGRALTTDLDGNIWMGNHDGLSCYSSGTSQYKTWSNESGRKPVLYSNVIRSMVCDQDNNIWIGTGNGVNRYNRQNGQIEFISSEKLPASFYNSINTDRSGNIWFCTNDSVSLYWYDYQAKTFHSVSEHPHLKQLPRFSPTSYFLEDSRERLWISFARKGVYMYNKKTGELKHFKASDSGKDGIIGDQVIEIKEDQQGMIWMSTFNGVSGYDPEKNSYININNQNGLPGNMAAPLAIDRKNRIWVGVNGGLTLISADRKHFTSFSTSEGLPSLGYSEHAGCTDKDGNIVMPTYYGYFRFNPDLYQERKDSFRYYLAGYSIFDKDYKRISESDNSPVIRLNADQNSFTFHMAALNYKNPSQTWFIYRLEGFEKDWHYSQDPKAVYTNVPGGRYTFQYRASISREQTNDQAFKTGTVLLATRFYKTTWFRILLFLFIVSLFYIIYRYRTYQQKQFYLLKEKAQLLEKEKALVMYENLKQQLNPHFLFNSLTSLSSLISSDPGAAGGFLDSLSKTYRYILQSRDHETVLLADEIKFAMNYIKLQQTRFETGFEVLFRIPEEYYHRRIVPVTLQNLIENAIKHNIIDEESPLKIDISISQDDLVVQNNLQKKKVVETSNKQGLANMQSLYRYLSPRPMRIEETATSFIVRIPLL